MQIFRPWRRPILAAGSVFASFFLSGCVSNQLVTLFTDSPYLAGPDSYISPEEVKAVIDREALTTPDVPYRMDIVFSTATSRNDFVLSRMFIIDRNYNEFEGNLTKEDASANFFGSIASLGASTAAATIPVGQTTKILAATVTGINGTKDAFNSDVLKTKTIQTIQAQMRTDRAKQAKVIIDRLACDIGGYPGYLALADLEAYRQAGTIEAAQQGLAKTVATAEEKAEQAKAATSKSDSKAAIKDAAAEQIKQIMKILKVETQTNCPIDTSKFTNHNKA